MWADRHRTRQPERGRRTGGTDDQANELVHTFDCMPCECCLALMTGCSFRHVCLLPAVLPALTLAGCLSISQLNARRTHPFGRLSFGQQTNNCKRRHQTLLYKCVLLLFGRFECLPLVNPGQPRSAPVNPGQPAPFVVCGSNSKSTRPNSVCFLFCLSCPIVNINEGYFFSARWEIKSLIYMYLCLLFEV